MLVGTVIGVLVIPGLYFLFGWLADGRKLLKRNCAGGDAGQRTQRAAHRECAIERREAPASFAAECNGAIRART